MRNGSRIADHRGVNKFTNRSDAAIASTARTAAGILAVTPGYGVPTTVSSALGTHGNELLDLIDAAKQTRDTAVAATLAKQGGREKALASLNAVAAIVYNNGTPDSALESLGFSPRSAPTRPVQPITVAGLSLSAGGDGTIRLGWKRSGNRPSAIFQIERSLDEGASWEIVGATSQTKASLAGYAPGVPVWFRVTTTNSVGTSLPSGTVGVYVGEETAPVALKLAA